MLKKLSLISFLFLLLISLHSPNTPAEGFDDATKLMEKTFADNGLTESWNNFKKYFVADFDGTEFGAQTAMLKSLSSDPVKAISVVSGFGKDLAECGGKPNMLALMNTVGRIMGYQIPEGKPEFAKKTDAKELIEAICQQIETAGSEAVIATSNALFKSDRYTTHTKLATTIYRLIENIYLNLDASKKLCSDLSKTKTEIWIDILTSLRNSKELDIEFMWKAMRNLSFLDNDEVLKHIYDVLSAAEWEKQEEDASVEGSVYFNKKMSYGRVIIGGIGKTTYKKHAALIIDLGGNDTYEIAAGSTDNIPASIIIDFKGGDKYISERFEGRVAGGMLGLSLLIDCEGVDKYACPTIGLGAGFYGASVLIDKQGADKYSGGNFTCGAGMYGFGILWDQDGDDTYECGALSQGFGGPLGFGLLLDTKGNDKYKAHGQKKTKEDPKAFETYSQGFGLGFHPLSPDGGEGNLKACGGIGMLVDSEGNDNYDGGYCTQGSAFYHGVGVLMDIDGKDFYKAKAHSQGSSMYAGIGLLIENSGDDKYTTTGSYTQGSGYDAAFGALIDFAGDDSYQGEDYCQGASAHKGCGVLLDLDGKDAFKGKESCQAIIGKQGEHWEEDWPSIAMLITAGADIDIFAGADRKQDSCVLEDFCLFFSKKISLKDILAGSMKIK